MNRFVLWTLLVCLISPSSALAQDSDLSAVQGALLPRFSTGGQWINSANAAPITSTLVADGAIAPVTWTTTLGSLPPGIILNPSGAFTGTSTATGQHEFSAQVVDGSGASASASFVIDINAGATVGTVQPMSFTAASTGLPVNFTVYLPPNYAGSSRRYPVLFHLHGIGGAHNGNQILVVPQSHEAAVRAGLVQELILVFPDGFQDSFWADSANSAKPAETHLVQELLPFIDNNFRTMTAPGFRIIQGFSMGGFGAAKFATKFPGLFRTCVIYDGAMLSWTQVQQRHAIQAQEIFNNDSARFEQYSPWAWLTLNGTTLASSSVFRDSVGALQNENRAWRDALAVHPQSSEYVETGLPHAVRPLLDAQGANSWALIGQRLLDAEAVMLDGFE